MRNGQPLNFDVWLSYLNEKEFWLQEEYGEPVWSMNDFELYFAVDEATNRQLNMTLPLTEDGYQDIYKQNRTLYMHYQMETPDPYEIKQFLKMHEQQQQYFRSSTPLVKYMKERREETVNLLDK